MSAAPILALESYWSGVKFNGRAPRDLEELLIAKADHEHARRRAEIKGMAKRLAEFGELLPVLRARGIELQHRTFSSFDKSLRIQTPIFSSHDDPLHAALLELGFKETARTDYGSSTSQVTLQRGRWLAVTIDISKSAPIDLTAEPVGAAA